MVGYKAIAIGTPVLGEHAASTPARSDARVNATVRAFLARLLDGPPLIPGDVDSSVLPRATRDAREQAFLLRRGPRQS
jgi:hypothetical protein